jgi:hypothetical protein
MTPEQAAHELAPFLVGVAGRFMTDPATFARGAELGFDGFDFYVAGRAGVLGDVPGEVAAAALVFFAPGVVVPAWEHAARVMPARRAAQEFARCGHAHARGQFSDATDYARLAGLLGRVVAAADAAGAPIFAGLRGLAEPDDPKALALHRANALRELRGALHAAAILTVGLTPHEAVAVRSPGVAALFGWPDPLPDAGPLRDRWALAEARTDRMAGRALAVLSPGERRELVDLTAPLLAG